MMNAKDFAMNLIARNPSIARNPQAQGYLDAINSGDQEKVKQIAMNICESYGVTPEQAMNDTAKFFGFRK